MSTRGVGGGGGSAGASSSRVAAFAWACRCVGGLGSRSVGEVGHRRRPGARDGDGLARRVERRERAADQRQAEVVGLLGILDRPAVRALLDREAPITGHVPSGGLALSLSGSTGATGLERAAMRASVDENRMADSDAIRCDARHPGGREPRGHGVDQRALVERAGEAIMTPSPSSPAPASSPSTGPPVSSCVTRSWPATPSRTRSSGPGVTCRTARPGSLRRLAPTPDRQRLLRPAAQRRRRASPRSN